MFEITFDLSSFAKFAARLGSAERQIPFALSTALNDAAFAAKKQLVQTTWPTAGNVYNTSFLGGALYVNKSSKNNLEVEIVDQKHRANLALHAHGGTKTPRGGSSNITIPFFDGGFLTPRRAKGIPKEEKPKALLAIINGTVKNPRGGKNPNVLGRALRLATKGKPGIYIGAGGRLHPLYFFKRSVQMRADVPFDQDFRKVMIKEMEARLPAAVKRAMDTAR
jgi:hypothetical protein